MTNVASEDATLLMGIFLGRRPSPAALIEMKARDLNHNVAVFVTSSEFFSLVGRPLIEGSSIVHETKSFSFQATNVRWLVKKLSFPPIESDSILQSTNWRDFFDRFIHDQNTVNLVKKSPLTAARQRIFEDLYERTREVRTVSARDLQESISEQTLILPDAFQTLEVASGRNAQLKKEEVIAKQRSSSTKHGENEKQPEITALALLGHARRGVLQLEKEVLSFLQKLGKADPKKHGTTAAYYSEHSEEIRTLSSSVANAVISIKHNLTEARQSATPSRIHPEAIALSAELSLQLAQLSALNPTTPYYSQLRDAVNNTTDFSQLFQVQQTLTAIDLRVQGQLPRVAGHFVSIVMPVYNRAKRIKDAISSVLAQSHSNFELIICDDASDDATVETVQSFKDRRIRLIRQNQRGGAAVARNKCLKHAQGDIIAYLDSDNIWHPRFVEIMLERLDNWPGQLAAYAGYFDLAVNTQGTAVLRNAELRPFFLEDQIEKPFVDLNSFLHSRRVYETLGGFDERLVRRQDYDLISRYCWSREPQAVPYVLNLYQRLEDEEQITKIHKNNPEAPAIIHKKIEDYYVSGLPAQLPPWLKKVSVLSWDMSRNHFAKAFCVADALSKHVEVELISYKFFEEDIFQPLANTKPQFETKYFQGGEFPDFFTNFARGVDAITGDAIYAVKPRLTSFGVGLLANYHTGKPLMLECNDLETVVGSAKAKDAHVVQSLDAIFDVLNQARVPHDVLWSQVLDPLVAEIPVVYTHNINLNLHYGKRCLYMRNIKDDTLYDPALYDRSKVRVSLGFGPEDRIILFGGLVRKHKGIFELLELLDELNDPRYKLLVVGNRETPDLRKVGQQHKDNVVILPPQPPERMAEINLAADLVVLWLDPSIPAGQYQSPYKMSDALAMGPSIIASPTSDLAEFAQRELMWNVPFGDRDKLVAQIRRIFDRPEEQARRRTRARSFFQREFSYKSVFSCFALGASGVEQDRVYPVAERFAKFFSEFETKYRKLG